MATTLSQLSSEPVGAILAFDGTGQMLINLYLTGNLVIQQLIEYGVEHVTLNSLNRQAKFLPKLLASLRSLRTLSVNAHQDTLLKEPSIASEVEFMSPTLSELKFPISIPSIFGERPLHLNDKFIKPLLEKLQGRENFKHLRLPEQIELSTENIARMPPWLESLTAAFNFDATSLQASIAGLPRGLQHLEILPQSAELSSSFIASLPPTLTSLKFPGPLSLTFAQVQSLPRTITALHGPTVGVLDLATARALPPHTDYADFSRLDTSQFQEALQLLPRLKMLSLESGYVTPQLLRALPASITHIISNFNWNGIVSEDWPPQLRTLHVIQQLGSFSTLPPHLESLEFFIESNLTAAAISSLPASLIRLHGETKLLADDVEFPVSLTELNLTARTSNACFPMHKLPPSVVHLILSGFTVTYTQLLHLSPFTKGFYAKIKRDAEYDPQGAKYVARACELARIGAAEGRLRERDHSLLGLSPRLEITLEDLLPRLIYPQEVKILVQADTRLRLGPAAMFS